MNALLNRGRSARRNRRGGWSVFELTVVVFVIGDLLLLFAPWVEFSSDSARATRCAQNLKQLGEAAIKHASSNRFFPSGGWGLAWLGDPDRGFGVKQPGGWMYSILPHMDQRNLWQLGSGIDFDKAPAQKEHAFIQQITTPVEMFYCPARRETGLYDSIRLQRNRFREILLCLICIPASSSPIMQLTSARSTSARSHLTNARARYPTPREIAADTSGPKQRC